MKNVFQKVLEFEVDSYEDQTAEQIKTLISFQANIDHSESDCFACFFMGHGKDGKIIAKDNKSVDICTILDPIKKCHHLKGKPKLLFIQACRVEIKSHAFVSDNLAMDNDTLKLKPLTNIVNKDENDMFIYYSTSACQLSYEIEGEFFFKTLCTVFKKQSNTDSLSLMINEINRNLFKTQGQQPEATSYLQKEIFFTPKKNNVNYFTFLTFDKFI